MYVYIYIYIYIYTGIIALMLADISYYITPYTVCTRTDILISSNIKTEIDFKI